MEKYYFNKIGFQVSVRINWRLRYNIMDSWIVSFSPFVDTF